MKSSSLEFLLPMYMPKPLYKSPALDSPIWKEGVSTTEKRAQGVGSAYSVSVILVHGGKLWNIESERGKLQITHTSIWNIFVNCELILYFILIEARISQLQDYWHFGPNNSLPVQCRMLPATLASIIRCQCDNQKCPLGRQNRSRLKTTNLYQNQN